MWLPNYVKLLFPQARHTHLNEKKRNIATQRTDMFISRLLLRCRCPSSACAMSTHNAHSSSLRPNRRVTQEDYRLLCFSQTNMQVCVPVDNGWPPSGTSCSVHCAENTCMHTVQNTHTHTGGLILTEVHTYFFFTLTHTHAQSQSHTQRAHRSFHTAQSALCTQRSECVGRPWQGNANPGWWFIAIVKAWALKGCVLPTSVLLWPPGAHVWHSGARLSLSITCIETWVLWCVCACVCLKHSNLYLYPWTTALLLCAVLWNYNKRFRLITVDGHTANGWQTNNTTSSTQCQTCQLEHYKTQWVPAALLMSLRH